MIDISCQFYAPLGRTYEADYVRSLKLSIVSSDNLGNEVILGRISADQILVATAELDDQNLFDVCDEDSEGMYDLYRALFNKGRNLRPELSVTDSVDQILFIWHSTLHEKLRPYEQAIVEAVGSLFGEFSIVVMLQGVTNLTDSELSELAFAKISGTDFVFKHASTDSQFKLLNPKGIEVPMDFEVSQEDQIPILEEWNKLFPRFAN